MYFVPIQLKKPQPTTAMAVIIALYVIIHAKVCKHQQHIATPLVLKLAQAPQRIVPVNNLRADNQAHQIMQLGAHMRTLFVKLSISL